LKAQLIKEFEMNHLCTTKKILGIKNVRDRKSSKSYLNQQGYIEKVIHRFNMHNKLVSTPLLHISDYPQLNA
jgi:hypothetical protein